MTSHDEDAVVSDTVNVMNSKAEAAVSRLPGSVLSLLLVALTIWIWPPILGRFISLDWRVGEIRPIAYGLQAVFGLMAISTWLLRNRINGRFARAFPTRKHLIFTLIGLSLSAIFALLLAEAALRILDFPFKTTWSPAEFSRAQFDSELGWTYIPSQSIEQQFVAGQPEVSVHINSIGSRVRAPEVEHDPAAPSVLLVGGSFTMGYGLDYEDTFAGQLEATPGFPLQVINLGVEAYGTDQALLMMKRYMEEYDTRAVVYTFIDAHPLRNANYDRRMLFRGARFVGTKPLFAVNRDGTLVLEKEPLRFEDYSYSHVWASLQFAWTRWGPKPTLDLTKALIREMNSTAESKGAAFILVDWNWGTRPENGSAFQDMALNLIDLGMDAPADWADWHIPGDSHPNPQAHSRAAALIAEKIAESGLTN